MARTTVEIIVDTSQVDEMLETVLARLETLEIPLANIALLWSEHMATLFATAPWPPLRESTLALKAALGAPSDPLVRSGSLKDVTTGGQWSITGGAGEATARLTPPGYGMFHITGFRHRGGTFVPARDFSMLDESTVDKMVEVLGDYLVGGP